MASRTLATRSPGRWAAALGLLGALMALALMSGQPSISQAQEQRGLFGDLRARLTSGSPHDTWERARSLASAAAAATLMKELVTQERDADVAALASLWLGHYSYGAGRLREAYAYFERAREAGPPETQAEAVFWVAHCGNLLETNRPQPSALPVVEEMHHVSEVLTGLAVGDAAIRTGDPRDAIGRYLALEGEARRLRCLAPLYYRVALVIAATESSGRTDDAVGWSTVRGWESEVALAPERALVALLETGKIRRGEILTERTGDPDTQFSEPPAESGPGAEGDDALPAEDVGRATTSPDAGEGDGEDQPRFYVIQLGAYHERTLARAEMERLTTQGLSVRLEPGRDAESREIFRIRLGRERSREEARELAERLVPNYEYEILEVRQ